MMKKTNGTWSLHDGDKKVTEGNLSHVMRADYERKNSKKKKSKGSHNSHGSHGY